MKNQKNECICTCCNTKQKKDKIELANPEQAILLSIHPEYTKKIMSGGKCYEYRKYFNDNFFYKGFKTIMFMYATKPIGKIVGAFELDGIIRSDVEKVWWATGYGSGMNKRTYLNYYKGKKEAIALCVGTLYRLPNVDLSELKEVKRAPQSYMYLTSQSYEYLKKMLGKPMDVTYLYY